MIRVLIAEDQAMFRTAIRRLLELEPDLQVIAEVSRGDEVLVAFLAIPAAVELVGRTILARASYLGWRRSSNHAKVSNPIDQATLT